MNRVPTAQQQRLDADFAALFGVPSLPPITAPLSPDDMAEGDLTSELC